MELAQLSEEFGYQLETLPDRLGGHIGLSLASLCVGILISIPLGIFVYNRPKAEAFFMTLASIIQTIPALALLAIMVFAFGGIGWWPACIALILYSILPMLRSTVTGMQGIEPAYLEAAKGIGMDVKQTLYSVQLPLALPSIVSGIRTASVWVVGAATLAQPVGAVSLGNYIFVGLQTLNWFAIFFGCLFSALLALAFDQILRGLEISARKRNLTLAIAMGLLILGLALLPRFLAYEKPVDDDNSIVVASKNFSESYILMEVIKDRLVKKGFSVKTQDGMGSAIVFQALTNGDVDCYVDYSGTIWANYLKRSEPLPPKEMLAAIETDLKKEFNVVSLGSLGFSNDYVFMMRKEDAARLNIKTLEDLARHSKKLKIAADIEFFGRPEWPKVQKAYGIDFKEKITMEPTLMYGAIDNKNVDVIVAFRTDGRTINLSVIDDTRFALPPYDGVLLITKELSENPEAISALQPLIGAIRSETMRDANAKVDVEKKPVEDTANWLQEQIFSSN